MSNRVELKYYIEGALMAAISVLIALIGFYIPPFQFITVFVWFVPIVVVAVRHDFNIGILSLITAAILLMILAPPWRAFLFILQFAGLALAFCYYFKKQAAFSQIIMIGTMIVAVMTIVTVILSFLVMGFSLAEFMATFDEIADSALAMYERLGLLDRFEEQGMSLEEIRQSLINMSTLMFNLIPAVMVTYGMIVAFISYFITRMVLLRLNLQVSEQPMFRHWQIPWYFIWGVIIGLGLLLYSDFRNWPTGSVIGMNIVYIYLPIIFIQGLSVITYFYFKWKISLLLKLLLLGIIVLNFPIALMVLLLVGLFDPLFNYRKLGLIKGGQEKG
ncbi:MAG: YybS family protein [Bacillota bacterium]